MLEFTEMTVTFLNTPCRVQFERYRNGRLAILLRRTVDDMPMATATVNVPAVPLEDDQVLIKDYAENRGVLAALRKAGIVCPTNIRFRVGYAQAEVCRLLIDKPTLY